jgi:hypothetical protein
METLAEGRRSSRFGLGERHQILEGELRSSNEAYRCHPEPMSSLPPAPQHYWSVQIYSSNLFEFGIGRTGLRSHDGWGDNHSDESESN